MTNDHTPTPDHLRQGWASMRELLERNNDESTIEIARLMFFYGAGMAVREAVRSPLGLIMLAAELRDIEKATTDMIAESKKAEQKLQ